MSLNKRHTVFVESVQHTLSIFDSVKGTKRCFCFLLDPEREGVWYRRYSCISCPKCKELDFLNCTNEYKGNWQFQPFYIQSSILYKLLDPYFGPKTMVQRSGNSKKSKAQRQKKSKDVKKLILAYL